MTNGNIEVFASTSIHGSNAFRNLRDRGSIQDRV